MNEGAVGAALTGDAPTTSEWSTIYCLLRCDLYKKFEGGSLSAQVMAWCQSFNLTNVDLMSILRNDHSFADDKVKCICLTEKLHNIFCQTNALDFVVCKTVVTFCPQSFISNAFLIRHTSPQVLIPHLFHRNSKTHLCVKRIINTLLHIFTPPNELSDVVYHNWLYFHFLTHLTHWPLENLKEI